MAWSRNPRSLILLYDLLDLPSHIQKHWPHVVIEPLKWGWSTLRCALSVK